MLESPDRPSNTCDPLLQIDGNYALNCVRKPNRGIGLALGLPLTAAQRRHIRGEE